jgi:hypothetical protein
MNEQIQIVCPHCSTPNRVESIRLGDQPLSNLPGVLSRPNIFP